MPRTLFLVPGFGAQGGALDTVKACFLPGGRGAIVNSARAVMYPDRFGSPRGTADKDGIRQAAQDFVAQVRGALR
jgi:orotidine-5'-phosphate decarboxylase